MTTAVVSKLSKYSIPHLLRGTQGGGGRGMESPTNKILKKVKKVAPRPTLDLDHGDPFATPFSDYLTNVVVRTLSYAGDDINCLPE